MVFLILVVLEWFLNWFTAFNTASCDGIYPPMVSDSLRHRVSAILVKNELKQLLISLSSDMKISPSTKSNFLWSLIAPRRKV